MRTAIFLGCLAIADAIRADWSENLGSFIFIIFLIMAYMDIAEHVKKMRK